MSSRHLVLPGGSVVANAIPFPAPDSAVTHAIDSPADHQQPDTPVWWEQHVTEVCNSDPEPEGVTKKRWLRAWLNQHADRFVSSYLGPDRTSTIQHRIDIGDHPPIAEPLRFVSPEKQAVIDDKVRELQNQGIIRPSRSPFAAAVVLARKPKQPGQWRFAIDYRKLNQVTKFDAYPMARADQGLEALKGSNWFSVVDLASGFHQVGVAPEEYRKDRLFDPQWALRICLDSVRTELRPSYIPTSHGPGSGRSSMAQLSGLFRRRPRFHLG